jgi:hypothetical protein
MGYKLTNLEDPNDQYDLESLSADEAAFEALATLGWGITVEK